MNEDEIRRYGMMGLVAFNIVLILWVLVAWLTFRPWVEKLPNGSQMIHDFSVFSAGVKGAFFGLIVGGLTFYFGWKNKL